MSDSTMYVVVYSPSTEEIYMERELGPEEIMNERTFADQVADMFDAEIDDSDGYIPNCCGDIRVEFRPDRENPTHIWSGESFYFKSEDNGGDEERSHSLSEALHQASNDAAEFERQNWE